MYTTTTEIGVFLFHRFSFGVERATHITLSIHGGTMASTEQRVVVIDIIQMRSVCYTKTEGGRGLVISAVCCSVSDVFSIL
jgi:hypothetical protein